MEEDAESDLIRALWSVIPHVINLTSLLLATSWSNVFLAALISLRASFPCSLLQAFCIANFARKNLGDDTVLASLAQVAGHFLRTLPRVCAPRPHLTRTSTVATRHPAL
ncbi:hypothetical protein B0H19DRAFT_1260398 [Mycena capillaripes]|nr:hypothetical protein B0H19DRAFT_1260398 [Mycena capillaripes]